MRDTARRKRVMQRSIRLGHCICDPKQPCPCDLFKEKDICMCAGERMDSPTGPVLLTKIVEKAGCASKIDQAFLKSVLKNLPTFDDPRVLVGVPAGDDAGIYDMEDGTALVQTVDVFTPSVDDPYTFGQVAAANSVSDIYAMGGKPLTALSVIGFPVRKIADDALNQILCGGIEKMKKAGVAIIGGHSINDAEIKAGFAVTGVVDRDKVVTNSNAREGDVLILTKPLGTGIVAFASQIGRAHAESVEASAKSMTTLNKAAAELMVEFGAHAATDVTGFSLMGHLAEMALSSGVDVEVVWDNIPVFPHLIEYAAAGILPGAIERNKESCKGRIKPSKKLPQEMVDMCYDAQTSGGLLIAIAPDDADGFLKALHLAGVEAAAVVGHVKGPGEGLVHVTSDGSREIPSTDAAPPRPETELEPEKALEPEKKSAAEGSEIDRLKARIADVFDSAASPHGLDAYTKQAMAIALSVAARCELSLKTNVEKARTKGFTDAEIAEAALMGVSFGGAPSFAFYEEACKSLK